MRYKLNETNINAVCEEADAYLVKRKTESKERIRTKISIEETLLNYMSVLGTDAEFAVDFGGGLSKSKIRLTVPGESVDPFSLTGSASDEDQFMMETLIRMGQLPKWKYVRGANTILFTLSKKSISDWGKLLIAIASAIVLGLAIRTLPPDTSIMVQQEIVAPLLQTFLGFLNAVAGPMIFLSVVWGICSIGDASTFSEVGRHICVRFLLFLFAMTVMVVLISLPFFSLSSGDAQNGNQFSALYQMVLDIVPDNLFTPFSRGNTLQILFVGIIVGVTMLMIGKDTHSVAEMTEQLGFIVDGIMGFISKLVPLFVFGSVFNIIASSDLGSLAAGGKFFAGALGGCIFLMIAHTAVTCVSMGITPFDLWKRTMSTFIIAITTASSSAAFANNIETCTKQLGVSHRLANFGVPFGQILYKPGVSVLFWFAAVSVAERSGVEVSVAWYVTATVICIILSAAAPPVPGGMTASFTILFVQLALPVSNLAVVLSITSILDFLVTATNLFTGQCVLAITSQSIEKTAD
jgi:Na+/H+-dicarboxylate symporter